MLERLTLNETESDATSSTIDPAHDVVMTPRGHIGRIVTLTVLGGLVTAIACVVGPVAGAEEHIITGSVLLAFASAWALLALLSSRLTDQPQRWANVPAAAMALAAATILVTAPTGNHLGWVWPPALVALVVWMVRRTRRDLRSRTRTFVLYPVFAALALSAVGGAYETYRESDDPTVGAMPGRLVSVGDHRLHIFCSGAGSPTVVLEPGLGEPSPMMAAWIAPRVATATRVCVYDRAGRGWSESAAHPQDGEQVATDLHTLLSNAGEDGPYVLAGHSVGGIYALNFAKLFPSDVAGLVLLDSMHPEQYQRLSSWPGFYEMYRRASAVMPSLARIGLGRLVYDTQYDDLPTPERDQERAFLATPRHNRSVRDEFHTIRTSLDQAAELETLGDIPLAVVTAMRDAEDGWDRLQDDLATLSTNSSHRTLPDATHAMVVEHEDTAREASRAILDVVSAVRTDTPTTSTVTATTLPTTSTVTPVATEPERPTGTVDELVRVDHGRMHLRCVGAGPATVVLIAGWGDGGDTWGAVEPAVAERARVCSYSRFGTGASDEPLTNQTFATQAADLHTMLDAAGEPGPYVVLGHSFGGVEAVMFASSYADEVRGLVLLDTPPTTWPATVCSVAAYEAGCAVMRDPALDPERVDVFAAFEEVSTITSLGELPMTVVTAAHRDSAGLEPDELARLDAVWTEGVERWAALSSSSTIVSVEDTGHHIQVDQPQLVVDEVLELLP